mmetsp:Transcript_7201/g.30669  ORF Transcript_7201/g.30669 Transcript_7201/m.30669 type:complete len:286 (+) Transcript_7201:1923-2780(+)
MPRELVPQTGAVRLVSFDEELLRVRDLLGTRDLELLLAEPVHARARELAQARFQTAHDALLALLANDLRGEHRDRARGLLHGAPRGEERGVRFAHQLVQAVVERQLERLLHGFLEKVTRRRDGIGGILERQGDSGFRVLLVHGARDARRGVKRHRGPRRIWVHVWLAGRGRAFPERVLDFVYDRVEVGKVARRDHRHALRAVPLLVEFAEHGGVPFFDHRLEADGQALRVQRVLHQELPVRLRGSPARVAPHAHLLQHRPPLVVHVRVADAHARRELGQNCQGFR